MATTRTLSDRILSVRQRADRAGDHIRTKQVSRGSAVGSLIASVNQNLTDTRSLGTALRQYQAFRSVQFTAISAIAKRIAGQEICVGKAAGQTRYDRGSLQTKAIGDDVEPFDGHAMLDVIGNPNPLMPQWSLIYSTVASLELTGYAYWWFMDGGDGWQVWPTPASWVEPVGNIPQSWIVRPRGSVQEIPVPLDQIVQFNLPDPGDPWGAVSPLQSQNRAVNTDDQLQTAQQAAFEHGIFPGMAIIAGKVANPSGQSMRPEFTPEQREQLIASIKKYHHGACRNGEPIVLDNLIEDVKKISNTPEEMDFMNSGKSIESRILKAFGVNPIILGEIEGANRASAWVAEDSFSTNVCNPLISLISQTLTAKACPLFEAANERLVCWIKQVRARDPEMKLQEWNAAAGHGYVTPNEYRRNVLNLDDMDGGDELPVTDLAMGPAIKSIAADLNPYTMGRLDADRSLPLDRLTQA